MPPFLPLGEQSRHMDWVGYLPWGEHPISPARFSCLSLLAMRKNNVSQAGAKASASLQGQTIPTHPILAVDGDHYICHCNVEKLIRHGFGVNAAKDGKVGWWWPVPTVRSSVRCD